METITVKIDFDSVAECAVDVKASADEVQIKRVRHLVRPLTEQDRRNAAKYRGRGCCLTTEDDGVPTPPSRWEQMFTIRPREEWRLESPYERYEGDYYD